MEYRVYAEDPSRNFLPSIGFLKKYKEPVINDPSKRVRIDTGVEEGSEISMYYDPMIAKLITWGKDREESMHILDRAFDEYVIQGLAHNIGFGKSILANESFYNGDYSTAFIPTFYESGFSGDDLNSDDHTVLAAVSHKLKNIYLNYGQSGDLSQDEFYIEIEGIRDAPSEEFKVTRLSDSELLLENLRDNSTETISLNNFNFDYSSLITLNLNGSDKIL